MRIEVFYDEEELFGGETEGADVEASKEKWATLVLKALVHEFPGTDIEVTELRQVLGRRMEMTNATLDEEKRYWDTEALVREIEEDIYSAMGWLVMA